MNDSDDIDDHPSWDASLAKTLPGQRVLVGLTYFDGNANEPVEQKQVFGRVISADEQAGILLSLEGQQVGEQFNLPPDTRSFQKAGPGEYRLRSTGEVVVDPDFTVSFSIHTPENPQRSG